MPLEDFIICVYCLVDELMKNCIKKPLRQRGFKPKLSDAEVITIDTVGEFIGKNTDVGIWRYFSKHWYLMFPKLGSRSTYVKQSANLWKVKQDIQSLLSKMLGAQADILHMADGFPMPICHYKRSSSSRIFNSIATYGYCASKSENYYGFKGNVVISSEGIITGITFSAANVDERDSLYEIVGNIKGLLIADKGLIGEEYQKRFYEATSINLQTPTRENMTDTRGKDTNQWIISTRRLVETVIGQLVCQFNIAKVNARDLWHLTNRVARKVLAHTLAIAINKLNGNSPLQFEKLGIA